jgi:gamma-glutamyltranspeptidase/glutathione hydrolase
MGHNSPTYIHTVTEALKLALADRDAYYGDPDFANVPAATLLSAAYAAERRQLIDPAKANNLPRPGDPWRFEQRPRPASLRERTPLALFLEEPKRGIVSPDAGRSTGSPDTTSINVADARGNLFSASPSSAWFFGGVFVAGDTGVPLGNRMQAFVLLEGHPNIVAGGKRPRTTLTPTVVLRDGKPFLALSSPGGDSQDQQALQVLLNIAVFGMPPQEAIESPRFNTLQYDESFGDHRFRGGVLELEDRIAPDTADALRRLGHKVQILGPFMMDTGTTVAGFDPGQKTVFGAADVRRQRFVTGW